MTAQLLQNRQKTNILVSKSILKNSYTRNSNNIEGTETPCGELSSHHENNTSPD